MLQLLLDSHSGVKRESGFALKLVLCLGGSVLFNTWNADAIRRVIDEIIRLVESKHRLWVVVGGGRLKRELADLGRQLGLSEFACDTLGIRATRIFAYFLASALDDRGYPDVPSSVQEAAALNANTRVVFMGGTEPGHSTTAVAALLAEATRAQLLVKLTDVDGVYSEDPRVSENALLIDELSYERLKTIVTKLPPRAGTYKLIDDIALNVLSRSGIRTIVANGTLPSAISCAIRESIGTLLLPDDQVRALGREIEDLFSSCGFLVEERNLPLKTRPLATSNVLLRRNKMRLAVEYRARDHVPPSAIQNAAELAQKRSGFMPVVVATGFGEEAVRAGAENNVLLVRKDRLQHLEPKLRDPDIEFESLRTTESKVVGE